MENTQKKCGFLNVGFFLFGWLMTDSQKQQQLIEWKVSHKIGLDYLFAIYWKIQCNVGKQLKHSYIWYIYMKTTTTTKNIPFFSQKLKYIGSLWQRIDGGKTPITHTHTHTFFSYFRKSHTAIKTKTTIIITIPSLNDKLKKDNCDDISKSHTNHVVWFKVDIERKKIFLKSDEKKWLKMLMILINQPIDRSNDQTKQTSLKTWSSYLIFDDKDVTWIFFLNLRG